MRPPAVDELMDPRWRLIDLATDFFEDWEFWDAITGLVEVPSELSFLHWDELARHVPKAAAMLRHQLARYARQLADGEAGVRSIKVTYSRPGEDPLPASE
ncbi:RNAse (barnase) inhibitor barstar [Kitasatospora gansuensis]|uniref:RNAse (Barnase) inhibitor barstar n=1 Tax=Kitasatospora gansuensis TaxID=258050 RepID=A0A7W7S8M9_9ACTN|nr:hypothetical protein [Kitasatospora gansuensis]MBB4944936.1 RNAse (barnase) inhibitor barstar [Kitasatospora gansuensis]